MKNSLSNTKYLFSLCKKYVPFVILIVSLGSIDSIVNVSTSLITKKLIDSATNRNLSLIYKTLVLLSLLCITDIFIRCISPVIATYTSANLNKDIQEKLYKHLIQSKWYEYSKYHSGNLLARITSDVDTVTTVVISTIPTIVSLFVLLVTSFLAILSFSPGLALMTLVITPFSLIFAKIYTKKSKELHIQSQEAEASYRSFVQESLQNLSVIKSFCNESFNFANLDYIQLKKVKLNLKKTYINSFSKLILYIGSIANFLLAFTWGIFTLYRGTGSFGTLTALIQLVTKIQGPFSGLAGLIPQISASLGSVERIIEIQKIPIEATSLPSQKILMNSLNHISIEVSNLDFCYTDNKPVLKNISFAIEPGEIVALIGTSGEGKTTLIRLLLSLLDYDMGQILFKTITHSIKASPVTRNLISYVPQGNTLFSGTIRDNLLLGDPLATDAELEHVSKLACADFIDSLEDKFSTIVGEKGTGLSEGQAQRLCIARAFLRKKPILILDEATSSLDSDTELKVLESIKNLKHKPTCIIITHRTSAFNICNKVLKLQNNTIIEVDPKSSYICFNS